MSSVAEQVTAVFDLIDSHRVPQAEQLLDPLLATHPQDCTVRAAHALILLRQDLRGRAKAIAEALADEPGIEKLSSAVQALIYILQNLCCWSKLLKLYEALLPQRKGDTALLENLCTTYIQLRRYADVQKTAMQLFQLTHNTAHQTWAIMANLFAAPQDQPDHLLLKIATKLMEQQFVAKKATYPVAGMYVETLRRQKRLPDAIAFVQSADGALLGTNATRLELLYQMHSEVGTPASKVIAALCAAHLWAVMEPDNWAYFLYCVEVIQRHAKEGGQVVKPEGVSLICRDGTEYKVSADAKHFFTFEELDQVAADLAQREVSQEKKLRGPFMAQLEIASLRGQSDLLHSRLQKYLEIFGSKSVCLWDVSKYTTAVQAGWYTSCLPTTVTAESTLETHQKYILRLQLDLLELSKPGATKETILSKCKDTLQAAVAGLRAGEHFSTGLAWSEEGKVDNYSSVAMNAAIRAFAATNDSSWLHLGLEAIGLAGARARNTPTLVLLSTLGYARLGVVDSLNWNQLDLKSMQYDSMARVGLLTLLGHTLMPKLLQSRIRGSERYYLTAPKEVASVRGKVFQHIAPTKQREVDLFDDAIRTSISRLESHTLHGAVALMDCSTKKDLVHHFASLRHLLESVASVEDAAIRCHHDDKVIQSVIYSAAATATNDAEKMADLLLPPVSLENRIAQVRIGSALLSLLHDVAAQQVFKEDTARQQQELKSKKGKKAAGAAGAPAGSGGAAAAPSCFKIDFAAVVTKYKGQLTDEVWIAAIPTLLGLATYLNSGADEPLATEIAKLNPSLPGLPLPLLSLVSAGLSVSGEGKQGAAAAKVLLVKLAEVEAIYSKPLESSSASLQLPAAELFLQVGLDGDTHKQRVEGKLNEQLQSVLQEVKRMTLDMQLVAKRR